MTVLVAIGVCFVCILGVGYLISRMGAAEKPKNDDREWFV